MLLFFCIAVHFCKAQISSIQLPHSDQEIKISKRKPSLIVSIYVDKAMQLYLEGKNVNIDEINPRLEEILNSYNPRTSILVFYLYIDKSVPYSLVDKIKTCLLYTSPSPRD